MFAWMISRLRQGREDEAGERPAPPSQAHPRQNRCAAGNAAGAWSIDECRDGLGGGHLGPRGVDVVLVEVHLWDGATTMRRWDDRTMRR